MSDEIVKLNRSFLGKKYSTGPQLIELESIRQFALATSEKNPRYLGAGFHAELVPPPLYPVVFLPGVLSQLVDDGEDLNLDMLRVVHAEHKMLWRAVLHPGDSIHTTARIINMEQHGVNDVLDLQVHCKRGKTTVVEMMYRLLVRGKKATRDDKTKESTPIVERGRVLVKKESAVTRDQGLRYANASGDHNPIHTSDEIARSAGLPSAILQGLCTMALASQVLVDELLDGDPRRLKSMEVRFSSPVFLDQSIVTEVYDAGTEESGVHVVHFESRDEKNIPVLVRGMAKFAG